MKIRQNKLTFYRGENMSKIEFVSQEYFPEDEYTKELVYLCLEGKFRVAYVRKKAQNGGLFWSVCSLGITRGGKKEYFPAFIQDSNFLERDIKDFLEKRKWETPGVPSNSIFSQSNFKPQSMSEVIEQDLLPF